MKVGDLGYAADLGNYAEYSGAPKEDEVLHYARVLLDVRLSFLNKIRLYISIANQQHGYVLVSQCATANPDGRPRALIVGGGIANFTDVAATFGGIIRAMREKVREITRVYM
jgi:ATP citrate (pro-S)-lyase